MRFTISYYRGHGTASRPDRAVDKVRAGHMVLKLALVVLLVTGCGTAFAVMKHPGTGHMVVCREDLFDGVTDTIGRCVEAFEQAGYVVQGRK
jgi:hypothetical protein